MPSHLVSLQDRRHRLLRDLRISVTDRCNFRCPYCMPKEVFGAGYPFLPRAQILSFEEIARLVRIFGGLGVRKVRLTGGEPLLRQDLPKLVRMLAEIDADLDLALTTNGALLGRFARQLKEAGLRRVTVSLDSLDEEIFRRMNDVDFPVAKVLEGIEAAEREGLGPIKVNAVVKRGMNDHTLVDLARHFQGTGHVLRFIEFMDVGTRNGWRLEEVVPAAEILRRIDAELPVEPLAPRYPGEVARRWRYRDGSGEIGIISSVTQPFCTACTRARLSAEGRLYTCLFASSGTDLKAPLRQGWDDSRLESLLARVWTGRDDRYSEIRSAETRELQRIEMSYIGG